MAETLDALVPGDSCRVTSLQLPPHKQRRMQELGLTVGSTVTALHRGPWGGIAAPAVVLIAAGGEAQCQHGGKHKGNDFFHSVVSS